MANPISKEIKAQLQITRTLFYMLLAGQMIFYLFTWFFIRNQAVLFNEQYASHFLYLSLPVVVFGCFFLAIYTGNKRKEKFLKIKHEQVRAEYYRETLIIQGTLVEMGSLFAVFVAFFTFSLIPYLFFVLGLLMFLYFFPSEEKYKRYANN